MCMVCGWEISEHGTCGCLPELPVPMIWPDVDPDEPIVVE